MRDNGPVTNKEVLMQDGDILVSGTDSGGRLVFANKAFINISGFTEDELIGAPHNVVRHSDMPQEAFRNLWDTIKAGKPWQGLVKNRCKNGDHYWVNANVTPTIEDGQITGFISIRTKPSAEMKQTAEQVYKKIREKTADNVSLDQGEIVEQSARCKFKTFFGSLRGRNIVMMLITALLMVGISVSDYLFSQVSIENPIGLHLAVLLVSIAATTAMYAISMRKMLRPVQRLEEHFKKIAQNDFEHYIELPQEREFRQTTQELRAVAAKMKYLVLERRESEEKVRLARQTAMASLAETVEKVLQEAVAGTIQQTGKLSVASSEITASSDKVSECSAEVSVAADQARSNAEMVSGASEQLAASIQEIMRRMEETTAITDNASKDGTIAETTVNSLTLSVDKIGEVARLIGDIAEQTNLLALNATIEAARAGDAGKGFAVVAQEVKNLANQTAKSTDEITTQINEVQEVTSAVVNAVQSMIAHIRQIDEVAASVSNSVEQQNDATQEIARNVVETAQAANDVTAKINDVSSEAEGNLERVRSMTLVTKEVEDSVHRLRDQIVQVIREANDSIK